MYFCTAFAFLVFKIIQILYRGERIAAHLAALAMTGYGEQIATAVYTALQ